ncbi:F-box protein At5g07610 [Ricinus communis]|uniref:F-box protein At5g07610 n=1 Tax=Ricinus communis TaxID=3988 RepID=UPI00201B08AC|nr:F-box protein At5g07610 [Ricinus communis]
MEAKSSAETVANSVDILAEILLRLPITRLLRFKLVSKQWLSLISDPIFSLYHTRSHLLNSSSAIPSALFLHNPSSLARQTQLLSLTDVPVPSKLPNMNSGAPVRIKQSCSGLLLCSSTTPSLPTIVGDETYIFLDDDYNDNTVATSYFICNPTTNQFKIVNFPVPFCYRYNVAAVILAFDPLKSRHYKLLSLRYSSCKTKFHIHSYSSETDSWSLLPLNINLSSLVDHSFLFSSAIYCRGVVHWRPPTKGRGTWLCLDVKRKLLKEMPQPPSYGSDNRIVIRYFGESGGRLHLVMGASLHDFHFDVLELALDYSEWSVRYRINLQSLKTEFPLLAWHCPLSLYPFSILGVVCPGKEEDSVVVILVDGVALAYNFIHGTSLKLYYVEPCDVVDDDEVNCNWPHAFTHFQNIFRL